MEALVSIIIPVYNSERYLATTLESALSQTWPNIEVILVDDGSSDQSLNIAKKFNSDKLRIFTQENSGASVARNLGLKKAKGDFIQFLDADDMLSKNKISSQVYALTNHPQHIAVCSTIHFTNPDQLNDAAPNPYEDKFLYTTSQPTDFLINLWGGNGNGGSMIQTNAWLIPKKIAQKAGYWEEFYSPDDDGEYFSRIILASKGIIHTKNCYNYYRKNLNSLSNRNNYKALNGCFKSVLLKKKHLFSHTESEAARLAIARQLISLALDAYPKHFALSKVIDKEVKKIGKYSYLPISGGPIAQKISLLLGWRITKFLQYVFSYHASINPKKPL